MADNRLDAIVHKTVEHQLTLIKDGINPPYVSQKGVPSLNTFLVFVSSITVPSGFTTDNLPVGITFFGRPYSEPELLKLGYAYEQATHHRVAFPGNRKGFCARVFCTSAITGIQRAVERLFIRCWLNRSLQHTR
jgi:Asp-tRNA(Asn)/Glu-tRNA(Gln) amidotransferase A subunit family amidase